MYKTKIILNVAHTILMNSSIVSRSDSWKRFFSCVTKFHLAVQLANNLPHLSINSFNARYSSQTTWLLSKMVFNGAAISHLAFATGTFKCNKFYSLFKMMKSICWIGWLPSSSSVGMNGDICLAIQPSSEDQIILEGVGVEESYEVLAVAFVGSFPPQIATRKWLTVGE